ncbi:MAG: hypothetical protein JXB00_19510 [Bacteroidales bacterium]|nr:hypothetical protein [Bacteroidales bacterium]
MQPRKPNKKIITNILGIYQVISLLTYLIIIVMVGIEVVYYGLIKKDSKIVFFVDYLSVIALTYFSILGILFCLKINGLKPIIKSKINFFYKVFKGLFQVGKPNFMFYLILNNLIAGITAIIVGVMEIINSFFIYYIFEKDRVILFAGLFLFGILQIHYSLIQMKRHIKLEIEYK